jgi:hypothetical protein
MNGFLRSSRIASALAAYALVIHALIVGFALCPDAALSAASDKLIICHDAGTAASPADRAPSDNRDDTALSCCMVYCAGHAALDLPARIATTAAPVAIMVAPTRPAGVDDLPSLFDGQSAQPRGPPVPA